MNDELLVSVLNVSKKYCRDLKTSLWYGVKDLTFEFFAAGNDLINLPIHQLTDILAALVFAARRESITKIVID